MSEKRSVKDAVARLGTLVAGLLDTKLSDLLMNQDETGTSLDKARQDLDEISVFFLSVESHLDRETPSRTGRPPATATDKVTGKTGRRLRTTAQFPAGSFILEAVEKAGNEGIRPKDIAIQVTRAAPGRHKKPSALVSTTLKRLHERKLVRRTDGVYYRTKKKAA